MSVTRGVLAAAVAATVAVAGVALLAAPAGACAGLVTASGNIRVLRTSTLAAYHDGIEHYVTAFTFQGEGAEFGSLVPLPAVPESIERGGDWTLQRLEREAQTVRTQRGAFASAVSASGSAEEIQQVRIDALDLTVLKGGGPAIADWATDHGFVLSADAPEVLDFYAARSPIFLAAVFDAAAARDRGQPIGDGTPVHITMRTDNPWVPLRILGLGKPEEEFISADVYLLTDERPALLAGIGGLEYTVDQQASAELLNDLRSDQGMDWVPDSMWFIALSVDAEASRLKYDLAVDATGAGNPSLVAAGLAAPAPPPPPTTSTTTTAAPSPTTTEFAFERPLVDPWLSASRRPPERGLPAAPVAVGAAMLPVAGALVGWKLRSRQSQQSAATTT